MGRWTSRDPLSMRIGMGASSSNHGVAHFLSRKPFSTRRVVAARQYGYPDGFNLYNYVLNSPTNAVDPLGEQFSPLPGTGIGFGQPGCHPRCDGIGPFDIPGEAERRRGSGGRGDDSSHHCWAVCMTGAFVGGPGADVINWIEDVGEIIAPSPDSDSDILANAKGARCARNHNANECPEDVCDKCCGTHPLRPRK